MGEVRKGDSNLVKIDVKIKMRKVQGREI